jgi:hypothetical protein
LAGDEMTLQEYRYLLIGCGTAVALVTYISFIKSGFQIERRVGKSLVALVTMFLFGLAGGVFVDSSYFTMSVGVILISPLFWVTACVRGASLQRHSNTLLPKDAPSSNSCSPDTRS